MDRHVAKGSFGMLMETDTKVIGSAIKPTVLDYTSMRMGLSILVSGLTIFSKGSVRKPG
jgi:hypothetical protein